MMECNEVCRHLIKAHQVCPSVPSQLYLQCLSHPINGLFLSFTQFVGSSHSLNFKARGLLVGILGTGVSPGSPNPDHILDQKVAFFTPVLKKLSYHYLD